MAHLNHQTASSPLTPDAAQRHLAAGAPAAEEFTRMRAARLEFADDGSTRVGVIVTGEVIEENRLLAYVTPWLKPPLPPRDDPRRRTFNLELVETGWAVFFPVYPSLPRDDDLNRAVRAAEAAWQHKRGAWQEFGADLLLGYEYRACLKLGAADPPAPQPAIPATTRVAEAFRRICVDVRSHEVLGLYGYHRIDPPYRMWVWRDQLRQACDTLMLRIPLPSRALPRIRRASEKGPTRWFVPARSAFPGAERASGARETQAGSAGWSQMSEGYLFRPL